MDYQKVNRDISVGLYNDERLNMAMGVLKSMVESSKRLSEAIEKIAALAAKKNE